MANVKNFGLIGVGSDLQFGKAGTRLVNNAGTFNFKAADGSADSALTAAGITSSAGNVTLTTGNLVLSSTAGTVSVGGDTTLSRHAAGVFQFNGSAAFMAPVGNTAARPTAATGMIRVNNDTPLLSIVEYYDGTSWMSLATGGSATTLQAEVDAIEASLGTMVSTAGVWNSTALVNANVWPTPPTDLTSAINTLAAKVITDNTLDEILPGANGDVIYNVSGAWHVANPGATSGVQGYDAGLAALAAKTSTGILVQTGADTYDSRTLTQPTEGITIANADGVSGNPTFALANDLAAVEGLTTFGYAVRTAADTWTTRTISGVSGQIAITNGDGVSTNTDIGLATVTNPGNGGTFVRITTDAYGRVTNSTAVVTSDITALVDSTYVNVAGDSMASAANLTFSGGGEVLGLPAVPTTAGSAASKAYVDAAVSGLNIHGAVEAATVSALTATYANGTLGVGATLTATANVVLPTAVFDGYTGAIVGTRLLVKNQADNTQNGVYVVTSLGVASTSPWILTRASDYNNSSVGQVHAGDYVFIAEGNTLGSTGWTQTSVGTGTNDNTIIGTDPIVFTQFSGAGSYTAGNGLDLTGTVFSVKEGAGIGSLPTGEVGIDLFTPSSGGIILTTDGSTRSTATGAQLSLLSGAGLTQDATGLYIGATQVTNGMLANSAIALNSDSGTGTVSLGGTLLVSGAGAIHTAATGAHYTVSVDAATSASSALAATLGVASFDSANFTSTAGFVTLNTVDTAHGGTGLTTFALNEVFYAGTTSTMDQSANFTFDGTSTLSVGGALPLAINGALGTISATATNSDLVLLPNGTGSVIVGPVGAGLIQSDGATALTVRGNTTLTLASGTGSTVMQLASGTATKVSVSGPTAADYATGLAANDLTNKQYVDTAIATGAAAGAIKAYQRVVPLNANGTTAIPLTGTMPAGSTVLSVKVQVTSADTGATLTIGKTGSVAAYMDTAENDPQTNGLYVAECFVTEASATALIATVASSSGSGSGSCVVIVTYQVAQ